MCESLDRNALSIGLITCAELPEPDHDEAPAIKAFADAGHAAEAVPWNGRAGEDLSRFDLCLIRAAWDYYIDLDRFLTWTDAAAAQTRLFNAPDVIRWNAHKQYLLDLARADLDIVPTEIVRCGAPTSVFSIAEKRAWDRGVVVKPAVGAGSWNARRFEADALDDAQRFLDALARERDVIVQPIAHGFASPGERSLIWIDGVWTHAIRKRPRYAGDDEFVEADGAPTAAERAIGERAIACAPGAPLYARLDLVPGDPETGGPGEAPLISELELIEPSLFLFCDGGNAAAAALADAAARAVSRPSA